METTEKPVKKATWDRWPIAFMVWFLGMFLLAEFRYYIPVVPLAVTQMVFSVLILFWPDRKLERRVRIGWRTAVMATAILSVGIMLLLRLKGK